MIRDPITECVLINMDKSTIRIFKICIIFPILTKIMQIYSFAILIKYFLR